MIYSVSRITWKYEQRSRFIFVFSNIVNMSDRTVGIIQARMGSTRLPEKVLKNIAGKSMLQRVVDRTRLSSLVDKVVVATSVLERDDQIVDACEKSGYNYVRGNEEDVLSRYNTAVNEYGVNNIVRITADCPLIGPETIDRVVSHYHRCDAEFVTNTLYYTYPDGLDVEVFSRELLERTHKTAQTDKQREHVTPYMRTAEDIDRYNVTNPVDISSYSFTDDRTVLRWTVDYPQDMEFIRAVFDRLTANGDWPINQLAVLELLERDPSLLSINNDRTHEW
jgi:spore coat polysaccharide biosynthesis protein SpsF (cytidylyltransferase family)